MSWNVFKNCIYNYMVCVCLLDILGNLESLMSSLFVYSMIDLEITNNAINTVGKFVHYKLWSKIFEQILFDMRNLLSTIILWYKIV